MTNGGDRSWDGQNWRRAPRAKFSGRSLSGTLQSATSSILVNILLVEAAGHIVSDGA